LSGQRDEAHTQLEEIKSYIRGRVGHLAPDLTANEAVEFMARVLAERSHTSAFQQELETAKEQLATCTEERDDAMQCNDRLLQQGKRLALDAHTARTKRDADGTVIAVGEANRILTRLMGEASIEPLIARLEQLDAKIQELGPLCVLPEGPHSLPELIAGVKSTIARRTEDLEHAELYLAGMRDRMQRALDGLEGF
jgi:hypothetical protein